MRENTLHKLLDKQYLITTLIEPRVQIVNYIVNGYDNNVPVLMNNRFLHFTAHNYYRSVIVDLCALFCNNKDSHKNNFHRLTHNLDFKKLLKPGTIAFIQTSLDNNQPLIKVIADLRNKQIAHYDFKKESIDFNFDNLKIVNDLFDLAKKIIIQCGSSFVKDEETVDFDFGRESDYLISLEELINDATNNASPVNSSAHT
jgi:hypothetical protein